MNEDINNIKTLIIEYYSMQYGEKVNDPNSLNFVCNITSKFGLDNYTIYISNRSLKHFVESRKESYKVKHNDEYAISQMLKMFDYIIEIIENGEFKMEYRNYNFSSKIIN